jgi:hypothetical protein
MRLICVLLISMFLTSCATPSASGFYWGKYPQTLYAYKKNPSPATRMQHQNELLRLMDYADSRNTRVPPGIYAEMGKLYLDQGDRAIALGYFAKEKQLYPESAVLLDQLQPPSASPTPAPTSTPKAKTQP